ncbi:hypothetical protein FB45DRAFT_792630 [Roridomyces roridus]|uniref:Uncharacterized protein n=1 Tax=Roridomyces roridus TaxID=1738132 RepID=A0AAD7BXN4_9AGAR|nr:hypothetical protein FB45DRAFT_792630 [Roridomyces roridus]
MQSFERANESQVSLVSWWSDSNPIGPTINLRTVVKPLVWLMYHRQALEYIRDNEFEPLTKAMLDIFCSYLDCKYVANRTKLRVWEHLAQRLSWDTAEAQRIAHSSVFQEIPQLLESPTARIRWKSAQVIAALTTNKSVVAPISDLNRIAEKLEPLLRDEDTAIVHSAMSALVQIALWSLENSALGYTRDTAPLTEEIVMNICASCLQSKHVGSAAKLIILRRLTQDVGAFDMGAQSILCSSMISEIPQLLESSNAEIRRATTELTTALTFSRFL